MATNAGVWAYTSNGTLKWTCDEALKVTERGGSLAIGNGILYAVLKGKGGVAAINTSNGKVSWTRASEQGDCYHPVLDSEGTVYFCEKNGGIYAVTSSGSLKWHLLSDLSFIYNGFAIGADSAAYISEYSSPFAVIKVDNGGSITELGTGAQSMAPVTIGPDQRLYYGLNGSVTTVDIAVGLSTTSTWPCRGANQQGTNSLR
jgi:outer membrane protein assembly factor BamB